MSVLPITLPNGVSGLAITPSGPIADRRKLRTPRRRQPGVEATCALLSFVVASCARRIVVGARAAGDVRANWTHRVSPAIV